jgi:hypothetical protein
VFCSAVAPVLLVAGWTVAAGLQPRSFDAVAGTISALAAPGAADRWVMTLVFAVVGAVAAARFHHRERCGVLQLLRHICHLLLTGPARARWCGK